LFVKNPYETEDLMSQPPTHLHVVDTDGPTNATANESTFGTIRRAFREGLGRAATNLKRHIKYRWLVWLATRAYIPPMVWPTSVAAVAYMFGSLAIWTMGRLDAPLAPGWYPLIAIGFYLVGVVHIVWLVLRVLTYREALTRARATYGHIKPVRSSQLVDQ
jgi:hypothetical protein